MKIIRYIVFVLVIMFMFVQSSDAAKLIWRGCLTGAATCLDNVDGNDVADGDGAFVLYDNPTSGLQEFYIYKLDSTSGATASSPTVIAPVSNAGTKRWLLSRPTFRGFEVAKISGTAGQMLMYEANSTDEDSAGFRGPLSLSANTSYVGQMPNAGPTESNMGLLWAASSSGSGIKASPYIHQLSFVNIYKIQVTKTVDWNPVILTSDGGTYINADNHGTTWQLPADPTNKRFCFGNTLYAQILTIDPNGTDIIVYTTIGGAGNTIYSSGALTDHICLVGIDTPYWKVENAQGTWTITP
jgi:hypothetical protein